MTSVDVLTIKIITGYGQPFLSIVAVQPVDLNAHTCISAAYIRNKVFQ